MAFARRGPRVEKQVISYGYGRAGGGETLSEGMGMSI